MENTPKGFVLLPCYNDSSTRYADSPPEPANDLISINVATKQSLIKPSNRQQDVIY